MIKLIRMKKPIELTDEVEQELISTYKTTGQSVWNKNYLRKALMDMSYNKCCYCETKVDEESKYMTVDHFHHKNMYPEEVVKWDNLLPSCSRCNSNKSEHDTYKEPIINPAIQEPKDFFYLNNYRLRSKDKTKDGVARRTIDVLGINDTEKIVKIRFKIGEYICDSIDEIYEKLYTYQLDEINNIRLRNRIIRLTKKLLSQAQKTEEYSAVVATIILSNPDFIHIKETLLTLDLWDEELEKLYQDASFVKFDTNI